MAILETQRWELFAQKLAVGEPAVRAYELAGFKPSRSNASRLSANDNVRRRVRELQETAARSAQVSIESLLGELEDARVRATSLDQLSAAVRAIEAKAKISGVIIERQQVEIKGRWSEEAKQEQTDDILRRIAEEKGEQVAAIVADAFGIEYRPSQAVNGGTKQIGHRAAECRTPKANPKREIG